MAETTKRERSASPARSEAERPESKRPREQDTPTSTDNNKEDEGNKTPEKTMADTENKNEEQPAVELDAGSGADEHSDSKPSTSAAGASGSADGATDNGNGAAPEAGADGDLQPQHISMRALIVTGDASIIIGKQGKHINEIRDKSGSKLTISESIPGNPERIMTVSGQLDAVSKAFGLIVRRINDEPFDQASLPGSRAVTIRFIIPNSRMGSVIGKGGTKIKEIQEASGARLNAGEQMLPGSTEVSCSDDLLTWRQRSHSLVADWNNHICSSLLPHSAC